MDPFDASLDLLRRLNPQRTAENVESLCSLVPEITEDLLASVDQPLRVKRCADTGKDYLVCDYNRDGDSYRSPWSNKYDPPLEDGTEPSPSLRVLEVLANDAFDIYRDLYFEGGLSSVYLWELDDGFAGVVLLKKSGSSGKGSEWDSIHVFEVQDARLANGRVSASTPAHYKLTSTVILTLRTSTPGLGEFDLGGNLTRQAEIDAVVQLEPGATDPLAASGTSHIATLGRLIEDTESKMRNQLQEVYFGKTKDIVSDLRSMPSLSTAKAERKLQSDVVSNLEGVA
ncbi:F-actin-capping protein subunit beta [Lipomyces oligophaga]|uniref:F-actin-capping protein subunit beta n=1 Tax=Lipomyces oligophaga TaxID=45792 RepID=UPI0034CE9C92